MAEQSSVVLIGLAKLKRNSDWHYPKCWNWRERLCLYPLAALVIVFGFYPGLILDLVNPTLFQMVRVISGA